MRKHFSTAALTLSLTPSNLADIAPVDFQSAYADFEKLYPGDPCLDLFSITGSFITRDYAAIYRALDNLERWTGGDPWLDNLRAEALLAEARPGAPEAAEKVLRAVIAEEPDLDNARLQLVKALARQQKYAAAVESLRGYETRAHIRLAPKEFMDTRGFLTSEPYRAYRAEER